MSALRSSAGPAVCGERRRRAPRRRSAPGGLARGPAGRRTGRGPAPRRGAAAARIESPSWALSASWPTNSSSRRGRSRASLLVVVAHLRGLDAVDVGPGGADHRRATFRAWAIRASGVSPAAPSQQRVDLLRREAEPDQAVAGQRVRLVGARDDDRIVGRRVAPTFSRSSTMIRSAVRLPMPGTACRRAVSPAATRRQQLARRAAGEDRERHLRADALDAEQQQEQVALLLGGEAVEQQRVVADDQVLKQRRWLRRHAGTWRSVSAETASR